MKTLIQRRETRRILTDAILFCLFLLTSQPGEVVAASAQTFTDSDGDAYSVRLSGPGSAVVTSDDPDGDSKGPVASIALRGTDATSVLT